MHSASGSSRRRYTTSKTSWKARAEPNGVTWRWTDDTEMALSIVGELDRAAEIDRSALAEAFARRMDPVRGYGAGAYRVLMSIRDGAHWREASRATFRGQGSFGNGAAMRVAPLGAFFADDLSRCVEQARASAEVTHAHDEGIAGAIAVATGAALAWPRHGHSLPLGRSWLESVLDHVPNGHVRTGIERALALRTGTATKEAARTLGSGFDVTAQDTVPFCLWVASWYSHDYAEAIWQTLAGLGDSDTTCAIVGGIAALQVGEGGIPELWRNTREALD
jgi:ADP-ribosylglycohydrolase